MWLVLTEDPVVGVMSGVNHIAGQVEASVATSIAQPIAEEPMIGETFLLDEPIADDEEREQHEDYDYDALEGFGVIAR